ncbi:MAG: alginate lyase family protein [Planctomycetota bacterium]
MPAGILVSPEDLAWSRSRIEAGDPEAVEALEQLLKLADEYMRAPVRPITAGKEDGKRVAPSGDPRDYVSLSPYWWPDPNSPNGEPYYRRDGEVNPERHEYDTPKLDALGKSVRTLGFAYAFTSDERYAERALEHVRAWFVDPETRMKPRMKYAQFVPGVASGRRVGIIDTNRLRWVPDALIILSSSDAWTERDTRETKRWFEEYEHWLMTSDLGQEERASENNHGTWFAAQVALYSIYAGDHETALEVIREIPQRIDAQIEPDGSQPHEAVRTQALHYHDFNLRGLLDLAVYADAVGYDLAGYESEDGRSIRVAIDYVVPYLIDEKPWPYQQIVPRKHYMYYQHLRRAAKLYDDPRYEAAVQALPPLEPSHSWIELLLPPVHES